MATIRVIRIERAEASIDEEDITEDMATSSYVENVELDTGEEEITVTKVFRVSLSELDFEIIETEYEEA